MHVGLGTDFKGMLSTSQQSILNITMIGNYHISKKILTYAHAYIRLEPNMIVEY